MVWHRLVVRSHLGAPLMGLCVSFRNKKVARNNIKSTQVFQINLKTNQMDNSHQNVVLELVEPTRFFMGTVGNASGSEVFRVDAMRSEVRDAPSSAEWWT